MVRDPYLQKEKASWDIMADDQTYSRIPTFQDNEFLMLLERHGMLKPSFDVLDIGCGAAAYSIAIKDRVHSCLGLDFSDRMLQNAKVLIRQNEASNVHLKSGSWEELDLDQNHMRERFDLVFSHTTPAVSSAAALQKLIDASRKYCVVCLFARVSEPVAHTIRDRLNLCPGTPQRVQRIEASVPRIFEYLYRQGYYPHIHYEDSSYVFRQELDQAVEYYTADAEKVRPLTQHEREQIRTYLTSVAENGVVEEPMLPCMVTFYWDKTKRKIVTR